MKYLILLSLLLTGCSIGTNSFATEADLTSRGRAIYELNCVGCHNNDPKQAGSVGPDVAGSSKELLEAKVLTNKYPKGYKPKRDTNYMSTFPHLKNDIPALTEYLEKL